MKCVDWEDMRHYKNYETLDYGEKTKAIITPKAVDFELSFPQLAFRYCNEVDAGNY